MMDQIAPALRRWQTWGWVFLVVAICYVIYLLVSGLLTPETPTTPTDNQMTMQQIVGVGQHGRSGWKFEAETSQISADGYTTTYKGVRDATFFRDGKPAYHLKADIITVDSRSQNYAANGGVHVWSTAATLPDELQTDSAYWDQSAQTLTSDTPTRFVYHGTTLHTTHMTVNMRTGASQLGDTSVDYVKPPGSPTPSVSAAPLPSAPSAAPFPSVPSAAPLRSPQPSP